MGMREEFEKWYQVQDGAPEVKELRDIFKLDEDGEYYFLGTRLGWQAWQTAWQAAQPKWIKCSEQMPPVDTIVVVSFKSLETSPLLWSGNEWDDEYGMIPIRQDVTHWMPLPKPPEE